MKTTIIPLLACTALLNATAHAQTISWGSEVFSDLKDSKGFTLDDGFLFEIGAFDPGFTPVESNVAEWRGKWNVFDAVTGPDTSGYNQGYGYFTGDTAMTDAGLSTSTWLAADIASFGGLNAFLWIRKGDEPVPGTEWLLARASSWVFPSPIPGCCDNELSVQWSVSDLTDEVPNWGRQGAKQGPGSFTDNNPHTLQTYTWVPEPSAALLGLLSTALVLRRRR